MNQFVFFLKKERKRIPFVCSEDIGERNYFFFFFFYEERVPNLLRILRNHHEIRVNDKRSNFQTKPMNVQPFGPCKRYENYYFSFSRSRQKQNVSLSERSLAFSELAPPIDRLIRIIFPIKHVERNTQRVSAEKLVSRRYTGVPSRRFVPPGCHPVHCRTPT